MRQKENKSKRKEEKRPNKKLNHKTPVESTSSHLVEKNDEKNTHVRSRYYDHINDNK